MDVNGTFLRDAANSLVGSIIISPEIAGEVIQAVKPESLAAGSQARTVYTAIRDLFLAGKPLDPVTISNSCPAGYAQYIAEVMQITPTAAHWKAYADIVNEQAKLSSLQAGALKIVDASDLTAAKEAVSGLLGLLSVNTGGEKKSFSQGLAEFLERQAEGKTPNYLHWGIRQLDDHLFAEPGDFIILGGEPSTGKTLLAAQLAFEQAKKGLRVCIYTLETNDRKLYDRLFSGLGNIDFNKIKRRSMKKDELLEASKDIGYYADKVSFDIAPAAGWTVAEIQADAMANRYDVIYIDYLQLIAGQGEAGSYERVTATSIGLHTMSQQTGITVVGLSQLSRPDKSQKQRKRVRMSDLRSSGQLEQDADIIMALTLVNPDDKTGQRQLDVIKNKEGETDAGVRFNFDRINLALRPSSYREPPSYAPKFRELPKYQQEELPF